MRNLKGITLPRLPKTFEIAPGVIASYDGAFKLTSPYDHGTEFVIVASIAYGWDHVSVSARDRCPTWQEMDYIKRIFFTDDEVVMQLHVARKDHINIHPNVLHLWRPQNAEIPLPPKELV